MVFPEKTRDGSAHLPARRANLGIYSFLRSCRARGREWNRIRGTLKKVEHNWAAADSDLVARVKPVAVPPTEAMRRPLVVHRPASLSIGQRSNREGGPCRRHSPPKWRMRTICDALDSSMRRHDHIDPVCRRTKRRRETKECTVGGCSVQGRKGRSRC